MNYRHAFHAGNFADVVKHAGLLLLLRELQTDDEPLTVIETHGGAGGYDLADTPAERTGEAMSGIAALMAAEDRPAAFSALVEAVRRVNSAGGLSTYPGSPLLISRALRAQDRYTVAELRDDDHAALKKSLLARANATAVHGDGWREALTRLRRGERTLVFVDPPFEAGDDYAAAAALVRNVLRVESRAVVAVWLPLKDLETFDAFVRELEALDLPSTLLAEARLRALDDPMRLNGCALAVVNAPAGLDAGFEQICRFVAEGAGTGGSGRVWRTGAAAGADAGAK